MPALCQLDVQEREVDTSRNSDDALYFIKRISCSFKLPVNKTLSP